MKKRFVSLMLAVMMVLSILPTGISAAGYTGLTGAPTEPELRMHVRVWDDGNETIHVTNDWSYPVRDWWYAQFFMYYPDGSIKQVDPYAMGRTAEIDLLEVEGDSWARHYAAHAGPGLIEYEEVNPYTNGEMMTYRVKVQVHYPDLGMYNAMPFNDSSLVDKLTVTEAGDTYYIALSQEKIDDGLRMSGVNRTFDNDIHDPSITDVANVYISDDCTYAVVTFTELPDSDYYHFEAKMIHAVGMDRGTWGRSIRVENDTPGLYFCDLWMENDAWIIHTEDPHSTFWCTLGDSSHGVFYFGRPSDIRKGNAVPLDQSELVFPAYFEVELMEDKRRPVPGGALTLETLRFAEDTEATAITYTDAAGHIYALPAEPQLPDLGLYIDKPFDRGSLTDKLVIDDPTQCVYYIALSPDMIESGHRLDEYLKDDSDLHKIADVVISDDGTYATVTVTNFRANGYYNFEVSIADENGNHNGTWGRSVQVETNLVGLYFCNGEYNKKAESWEIDFEQVDSQWYTTPGNNKVGSFYFGRPSDIRKGTVAPLPLKDLKFYQDLDADDFEDGDRDIPENMLIVETTGFNTKTISYTADGKTYDMEVDNRLPEFGFYSEDEPSEAAFIHRHDPFVVTETDRTFYFLAEDPDEIELQGIVHWDDPNMADLFDVQTADDGSYIKLTVREGVILSGDRFRVDVEYIDDRGRASCETFSFTLKNGQPALMFRHLEWNDRKEIWEENEDRPLKTSVDFDLGEEFPVQFYYGTEDDHIAVDFEQLTFPMGVVSGHMNDGALWVEGTGYAAEGYITYTHADGKTAKMRAVSEQPSLAFYSSTVPSHAAWLDEDITFMPNTPVYLITRSDNPITEVLEITEHRYSRGEDKLDWFDIDIAPDGSYAAITMQEGPDGQLPMGSHYDIHINTPNGRWGRSFTLIRGDLPQLPIPYGLEWHTEYERWWDEEDQLSYNKLDRMGMMSFHIGEDDLCQNHFETEIYSAADGYTTPVEIGGWGFGDREEIRHFSVSEFIYADLPSGTYKFRVRNEGDGTKYRTSEWSELSPGFVYTQPAQRLEAPDADEFGWKRWDGSYVSVWEGNGQAATGYYEVKWSTEDPKGGRRENYGSFDIHAYDGDQPRAYFSHRIHDEMLSDYGENDIRFRVRAIPMDITQYRISKWSGYSPALEVEDITDLVNDKLDDLISDAAAPTVQDVQNALQQDIVDLRTAMAADQSMSGGPDSGTLDRIRALEDKVADNVEQNVEAKPSAPQALKDIASGVTMVGATLNLADDHPETGTAPSVTLEIDEPKEGIVINEQQHNAVQFSMKLRGAVNHDDQDQASQQLIVPVAIDMPVPQGINPYFLVVLHKLWDGSIEQMRPYTYWNADDQCWHARFVVDSFSDFAFVEDRSIADDDEDDETGESGDLLYEIRTLHARVDNEKVDTFPQAVFTACAKIEKLDETDKGLLILAAYSIEGRLVGMQTLSIAHMEVEEMDVFDLTFDNSDGEIAMLRAFIVDSMDNMLPLSEKAETESIVVNDLVVEEPGKVKGGIYKNITISKSVGDGDVTLLDVEIHGDLIIRGGGSNTITIDGCEIDGEIIIEKEGGEQPRLYLIESEAEKIVVNTPAILEAADKEASIGAVIAKADLTVQGVQTTIGKINIENDNTVTLASGSVDTITVDTGTTANIVINAGGALNIFGDATDITLSTELATPPTVTVNGVVAHVHQFDENDKCVTCGETRPEPETPEQLKWYAYYNGEEIIVDETGKFLPLYFGGDKYELAWQDGLIVEGIETEINEKMPCGIYEIQLDDRTEELSYMSFYSAADKAAAVTKVMEGNYFVVDSLAIDFADDVVIYDLNEEEVVDTLTVGDIVMYVLDEEDGAANYIWVLRHKGEDSKQVAAPRGIAGIRQSGLYLTIDMIAPESLDNIEYFTLGFYDSRDKAGTLTTGITCPTNGVTFYPNRYHFRDDVDYDKIEIVAIGMNGYESAVWTGDVDFSAPLVEPTYIYYKNNVPNPLMEIDVGENYGFYGIQILKEGAQIAEFNSAFDEDMDKMFVGVESADAAAAIEDGSATVNLYGWNVQLKEQQLSLTLFGNFTAERENAEEEEDPTDAPCAAEVTFKNKSGSVYMTWEAEAEPYAADFYYLEAFNGTEWIRAGSFASVYAKQNGESIFTSPDLLPGTYTKVRAVCRTWSPNFTERVWFKADCNVTVSSKPGTATAVITPVEGQEGTYSITVSGLTYDPFAAQGSMEFAIRSENGATHSCGTITSTSDTSTTSDDNIPIGEYRIREYHDFAGSGNTASFTIYEGEWKKCIEKEDPKPVLLPSDLYLKYNPNMGLSLYMTAPADTSLVDGTISYVYDINNGQKTITRKLSPKLGMTAFLTNYDVLQEGENHIVVTISAKPTAEAAAMGYTEESTTFTADLRYARQAVSYNAAAVAASIKDTEDDAGKAMKSMVITGLKANQSYVITAWTNDGTSNKRELTTDMNGTAVSTWYSDYDFTYCTIAEWNVSCATDTTASIVVGEYNEKFSFNKEEEAKDLWFTEKWDQLYANWDAVDLAAGELYYIGEGNYSTTSTEYTLAPFLRETLVAVTESTTLPFTIYKGTWTNHPALYTTNMPVTVTGSAPAVTVVGQADGTYRIKNADPASDAKYLFVLRDPDGNVVWSGLSPYGKMSIAPWEGCTIEIRTMDWVISDDTCSVAFTLSPITTVTKIDFCEVPENVVEVDTYDELFAALNLGGTVRLTADITSANRMSLMTGGEAVLELNGYTLDLPEIYTYYGKHLTIDGTVDGSKICYSGGTNTLCATVHSYLTVIGGGSYQNIRNDRSVVTVTGGTFSADPSAFVPEGVAVKQENGLWIVGDCHPEVTYGTAWINTTATGITLNWDKKPDYDGYYYVNGIKASRNANRNLIEEIRNAAASGTLTYKIEIEGANGNLVTWVPETALITLTVSDKTPKLSMIGQENGSYKLNPNDGYTGQYLWSMYSPKGLLMVQGVKSAGGSTYISPYEGCTFKVCEAAWTVGTDLTGLTVTKSNIAEFSEYTPYNFTGLVSHVTDETSFSQAMNKGGKVIMDNDITVEFTGIYGGSDVVLDLNGHDLILPNYNLTLGDGKVVTICNSSTTPAAVLGAGGIQVQDGSILNASDCSIERIYSTVGSRAISLSNVTVKNFSLYGTEQVNLQDCTMGASFGEAASVLPAVSLKNCGKVKITDSIVLKELQVENCSNMIIYSGTFSSDPSAFVPEGVAVTQENGLWIVGKAGESEQPDICEDVWFSVSGSGKYATYTVNWTAVELASNENYYLNGERVITSTAPNRKDIFNSAVYPFDVSTMDIVIEKGVYNGERTVLYTAKDAFRTNVLAKADFTVVGQADGTYMLKSDRDLTGMNYYVRVKDADGTVLFSSVYETPYMDLYPWDGCTLDVVAGYFELSEDARTLTFTHVPQQTITTFYRPDAPADVTVTTADQLKAALKLGGRVTLGSDITLTSSTTIKGGEPVTLVLNGHTLNTGSGLTFDYGKQVTIDGTATGSTVVGKLTVKNGPKLTVNGGDYEHITANRLASVVMRDANVSSDLSEHAIYIVYCDTTELVNCTASASTRSALYALQSGTLTIDGGSYTTTASGTSYNGIYTSYVDGVVLNYVTAEAAGGHAGMLGYGTAVAVCGGTFTNTSTGKDALRIFGFDYANIGGTDEAVLQVVSPYRGLEVSADNNMTLRNITAGGPDGGYCSDYGIKVGSGSHTEPLTASLVNLTARGMKMALDAAPIADLTIENCTFIADPSAADSKGMDIGGNRDDSCLLIRDTTASGQIGLYLFNCAEVDLKDLTLTGSVHSIRVGGIDQLNIHGGQLNGEVYFNNNQGYAMPEAVMMENVTVNGRLEAYGGSIDKATKTITIKSGSFTLPASATEAMIYLGQYVELNIEGGTFLLPEGAAVEMFSLNKYATGIEITGGTFNRDPVDYVDTELYVITEENGLWTVGEPAPAPVPTGEAWLSVTEDDIMLNWTAAPAGYEVYFQNQCMFGTSYSLLYDIRTIGPGAHDFVIYISNDWCQTMQEWARLDDALIITQTDEMPQVTIAGQADGSFKFVPTAQDSEGYEFTLFTPEGSQIGWPFWVKPNSTNDMFAAYDGCTFMINEIDWDVTGDALKSVEITTTGKQQVAFTPYDFSDTVVTITENDPHALTAALRAGGKIILESDITYTYSEDNSFDRLCCGAPVVLDLNGHTITLNEWCDWYIEYGKQVTVTNSGTTGGIYGSTIWIDACSRLIIENGAYIENYYKSF